MIKSNFKNEQEEMRSIYKKTKNWKGFVFMWKNNNKKLLFKVHILQLYL